MHNKTLEELYRCHKGKISDKWSLYIKEYARIFEDYRSAPIRMLEIGIQNGGSLEIWSDYFENASCIIGSDIDFLCSELEYVNRNICVVIGDANSDEVAREIFAKCDVFDIVIDDGSHRSSDIVRSFARYFPAVADGGLYVVEDLHCSYWGSHEGGLFDPLSSISFFKALADVISHEHWGVSLSRQELIVDFRDAYGIDMVDEVLASIHSVEFVNSMCFIRRMPPSSNVLGLRFITGQHAVVSSAMRGLHLSHSSAPSQVNNDRSIRSFSAREIELQASIRSLTRAIESQSAEILEGKTRILDIERQSDRLAESNEKATRELIFQTSRADEMQSKYENLLGKYTKLKRIDAGKIEARKVEEKIQRALAPYVLELDDVRNSTSWRLSAPVRWVGGKVKTLKNTRRGISAMLERHGGLSGTLSQSIKLWRATGWHGISRSLRGLAAGSVMTNSGKAVANDYAAWVERYYTLDDTKRGEIRAMIENLADVPRISILMPTYKAKLSWLSAAIESVRNQLYTNWELCIADDASHSPETSELLDSFARLDPRIKVVHRSENGHISAASNSALALATGHWIALMDHDDLLSEDALFWMADYIDGHPDVKLIYSDEDKVDEDGNRKDAYFKPDWNLDLFYSQNMFSHLGLYDADLIRKVGGFRTGFEGSQDYDLVLRCIEHVTPAQIGHVPRVLYHWRVHPQSTASSTDAKPYAQLAGERALNEHFLRSGIRGRIEYVGNGYRAFYDLPDPQPLVSLIIPTRNALGLVRQCIDSILSRTTYQNYEIILVDNGSDDADSIGYFKTLAEHPKISVVRDDGEFNYSALNNAAVLRAKGEYVGLINNDIEVITPEWLSDMVAIASQPGVGAVGARLWYSDYTLQHGGVILGIGGVAGHAHKRLPKERRGYFERAALMQSFSAVTAACLVIQKKHYLAVDGLNETNLKVAFNDVDFCIRLRNLGLRNVWTPYAELFHHESATRGDDTHPEKQKRFELEARYMLTRWGDALRHDPAYNLNLTLVHEDFSLAWPPAI